MSIVYPLISEAVKIDNCIDIDFKNPNTEVQWNSYVEMYNNIMNISIINFARKWAKYMQIELSKGKKIEDIVKCCAIKSGCNTIPAWQYSQALKILCQVWKYGSQLEQWKNTKK